MINTKHIKNIKWLGFAIAFFLMAVTFWQANQATSYLSIVDGWAVLDRIIHLDEGDMTWPEFLFRPHGAHLHSIVYLLTWIDYHFFNGHQLFTKAVSYAATATVCLFFTGKIIQFGTRTGAPAIAVLATIAASVALITGIADYETMLHPFQVVLSVARMTYLVLLWYLIVSLATKNKRMYLIVMVLSAVAVTFHGTGYIFAGAIVATHLLVSRTRWQLLLCLVPFVTNVAIQSAYSPSGGEMSKIGIMLTIKSLTEFFPALFAYFVSPFTHLTPYTGTTSLLVIGAFIFLLTLILTSQAALRCMGVAGWNNFSTIWRKSIELRRSGGVDTLSAFIAILGLFVLASSVAAAIFWIIRNDISGAMQPGFDNGISQAVPPAFYSVLGAVRYGAFAVFAYVMAMLACLQFFGRRMQISQASLVYVGACGLAVLLFVTAGLSSLLSFKTYKFDDQLNISAAAISLGLSPIGQEGSGIWPGAKDDWYWANALPETVAAMKFLKKGPWHYLPELDAKATSGATYVPVGALKLSEVTSGGGKPVCKMSGILETPEFNKLRKSTLLPIVGAEERVVGYAVVTRQTSGQAHRPVTGYLLCNAVSDRNTRLFVAMAQTWAKPASARSATLGVAPTNLTNETWHNGIARNWTGYFVADTPENRALFAPGKIIRLHDSRIRTVIRQEATGGNLNIFLTGKNLDGVAVGYPYGIVPIN